MSSFERLLRRDGIITVVGLFALWALTWAYLAAGAGLGMSAWDMTRLALWPYPPSSDPMSAMPGMAMAPVQSAWDPVHWALMVAMWWTMMIAMMTPSAAPTILLYARVNRHAQEQGRIAATRPLTVAFVAGYFLAWLAFSIFATVVHQMLESTGIVSAMTMGSQVRRLSGAVLVVIGLYQLSPLKNACLSHCRAPGEFLARHWRPGFRGAFRLGVAHGSYCVGCCWLLMALLFVGGVMNLAWIATLSLLVLAEKVLATGKWVGYGAGVVLIAWGAGILLH